MTKKEQAIMQALIDRAELLAALRWTTPVSPDVLPPSSDGAYSEGWEYNAYSRTVGQAWSGAAFHGRGPAPKKDKSVAFASQGSQCLYSTKTLALKAMRYEAETLAAKALLEIDRQLEKANQSLEGR